MERIPPLARSEHPELEEFYTVWDRRLGYLPNTLLTISRKPNIVRAMAKLSEAVHSECSLPPEIRGLVGLMASTAASCNYCMAHNASSAVRYGTREELVVNLWNFETDALYSEKLRAALRFARAVATQPCPPMDEFIAGVRRHFTDTEVVEIAAICAFYGWWNRLNSGLNMELEDEPRSFCELKLPGEHWTVGRHGHAEEYQKA